jgi:hypothetical protein
MNAPALDLRQPVKSVPMIIDGATAASAHPLDDPRNRILPDQGNIVAYREGDYLIIAEPCPHEEETQRVHIALHSVDLLLERLGDIASGNWPPKPPAPISNEQQTAVAARAAEAQDRERKDRLFFVDGDNADCVVCATQYATAVYTNSRDQIVIRQEREHDDDQIVILDLDRAINVIDRLCDLVGIPSVGKAVQKQ